MIEYENLRKANSKFESLYRKSFEEFLESGWYILGNRVKKFEEEFAAYLGARHCIGVASGLDALILALDALDLPQGSEVIVPSNTYIATILAVVRNGLKPVLAEPDIRTYNLDPVQLEKAVTEKTKAVIAVHLYGKSCDMDPIMQTVKKYGLYLIEDAAQSHGARYKGRMTGTFGTGCFSFYPTKNLGALGDAGAVVCDDPSFAEKIRALRNYGSSVKYHNDLPGYNSRLDEIQAGFLSVKLKMLDEITEHKRKLAEIYNQHLDDRYVKPVVHPDYFDVYHIYAVRHPKRDRLREYLLQNGIKTEVHYPVPPHRQPAMKGILEGEYPVSDEIHRTVLSLPVSYFHTEEDILKVCEVMNRWQE